MGSTTDGVPRRRLRREERRALILDAAATVLADRDPTEVTLEEIADAAGISRALIYNYFADRSALLESFGSRVSDELAVQVGAVLSSVEGLRAALEAAVRVHLTYAREHPRAYRLAFTGSTSARQDWIRRASELLGDGAEGKLAGSGIVAAIGTLVLDWCDSQITFERAVEVISSMLAGAYAGLDDVGVVVTPTWPLPVGLQPSR
jgi:AcrR family transcriptional regulator